MTNEEQSEAKRVIALLGGPTKTGKLFGISKGAVSQWHENGIPDSRMMFLRLARPDIFAAAAPDSPASPPLAPCARPSPAPS